MERRRAGGIAPHRGAAWRLGAAWFLAFKACVGWALEEHLAVPWQGYLVQRSSAVETVLYVGLLLCMLSCMLRWAKCDKKCGPEIRSRHRKRKVLEVEESGKEQSWRNYMRKYARAIKRKMRRTVKRIEGLVERAGDRRWRLSRACLVGEYPRVTGKLRQVEPTRERKEEHSQNRRLHRHRDIRGRLGRSKARWIGGRRWSGPRERSRGTLSTLKDKALRPCRSVERRFKREAKAAIESRHNRASMEGHGVGVTARGHNADTATGKVERAHDAAMATRSHKKARRRINRKHGRMAAVLALVLNGGQGSCRGVRVGEAAHPGPFQYGGASSSSAAGIAETGSIREEARPWETQGRESSEVLQQEFLVEEDGTAIEAFEEPPSEHIVEELLGRAATKAEKSERKAWCEALDEGVGKMWGHDIGAGSKTARQEASTGSWMRKPGTEGDAKGEPVIEELKQLEFGPGAGAIIRDPWKEAHDLEAARLAARWARESRLYAENQRRRVERKEGMVKGGDCKSKAGKVTESGGRQVPSWDSRN